MKRDSSVLKVDKGFKAILKAEAALKGKSVMEFTKDIASEEKFFSEYLCEDKQKGLRRKNGFGFKF